MISIQPIIPPCEASSAGWDYQPFEEPMETEKLIISQIMENSLEKFKEMEQTNFDHIFKYVPGEDANYIPFLSLVSKYCDPVIIRYVRCRTETNIKDSKGNWPAHYAAMSGNAESLKIFENQSNKLNVNKEYPIIKYLMSGKFKGTDIKRLTNFYCFLEPSEAVDNSNNTLMHYMCMYGDIACITNIKTYYQEDIRVRFFSDLLQLRNNDGFTPLYMAVIKNNLRALQGFTKVEIMTKNQPGDRLPAVYDAAFRMNYYTIDYVTEKLGIPEELLSEIDILRIAAERGYSTDFFEFMCDEIYQAEDLNEVILLAVENGKEDAAFSLYRHSEHEPDFDGLTIMSVAAKYGRVLLIRRLIEYGVAPIKVDANGKTAAHYAMEEGRVNALKMLAPYFPLDRADIPNPYFSCQTQAHINTLFAADFPIPPNFQLDRLPLTCLLI